MIDETKYYLSENGLKKLPYNHPSRRHMKCINCAKTFDLTMRDKCPHCGKSYPYYTKKEWDEKQK